MTMKGRLVFALGLLALSCGGGDGGKTKDIPQADACPEASKAICAKVFSCPDDLILSAVKNALGGDETNCRTTIQQNNCGSLMCAAGQTYHGDKAAMCKDQFGAVTCPDLSGAILASAGNVDAVIMSLAPTCNQVCS
jgi:hypothetical protein